MLTAAANTLLQLTLVAIPVLVGYLAGRHIRQHHLDQIEADAWNDGFNEGFRIGLRFALTVNGDGPDDDLDRVSEELDAAVEQTHPNDQPWLN